MENNTITLDGSFITLEQLNEKRENLPTDTKIVETSPNQFETIKRMKG